MVLTTADPAMPELSKDLPGASRSTNVRKSSARMTSVVESGSNQVTEGSLSRPCSR